MLTARSTTDQLGRELCPSLLSQEDGQTAGHDGVTCWLVFMQMMQADKDSHTGRAAGAQCKHQRPAVTGPQGPKGREGETRLSRLPHPCPSCSISFLPPTFPLLPTQALCQESTPTGSRSHLPRVLTAIGWLLSNANGNSEFPARGGSDIPILAFIPTPEEKPNLSKLSMERNRESLSTCHMLHSDIFNRNKHFDSPETETFHFGLLT